jgi:uncharacterized protein
MSSFKEIEKILKENKERLEKEYNIKKIGIFGSYSRKEENASSDIDILVEFYETPGWEFYELIDFLEKLLGKKVDLVTKNALRIEMKDKILNEVIYF